MVEISVAPPRSGPLRFRNIIPSLSRSLAYLGPTLSTRESFLSWALYFKGKLRLSEKTVRFLIKAPNMVYEAIDVQYITSILDHTCTFNAETLAPLEMFKNRLFYHILKDFLITPVNSCCLSKNKDLNALVWFPHLITEFKSFKTCPKAMILMWHRVSDDLLYLT